MTSLTLACLFGFAVMVVILGFWSSRAKKLIDDVEKTIRRSHPGRFNKLEKKRWEGGHASLIPRRRLIRFLREKEYLSLGDSGLSEKCRRCYRHYLLGFWYTAFVLTYVGLWVWLDPNVNIG